MSQTAEMPKARYVACVVVPPVMIPTMKIVRTRAILPISPRIGMIACLKKLKSILPLRCSRLEIF